MYVLRKTPKRKVKLEENYSRRGKSFPQCQINMPKLTLNEMGKAIQDKEAELKALQANDPFEICPACLKPMKHDANDQYHRYCDEGHKRFDILKA